MVLPMLISALLSQADDRAPPPAYLSDPPGVRRISLRGLVELYRSNELTADAELKSVAVEVHGAVEQIGKDPRGKPFLAFSGEPSSQVRCELNEASVPVALKLKKGDLLIVRGSPSGITANTVVTLTGARSSGQREETGRVRAEPARAGDPRTAPLRAPGAIRFT